MKEDQFPCIDCITFPACKAQFANRYNSLCNFRASDVYDKNEEYLASNPIIVAFHDSLYSKCSIIKKYYKTTGYHNTRKSLHKVYVKKERYEQKQPR